MPRRTPMLRPAPTQRPARRTAAGVLPGVGPCRICSADQHHRGPHLRRRAAAAGPVGSAAGRRRRRDAAHALDRPQPADHRLGHGHGDRGAAWPSPWPRTAASASSTATSSPEPQAEQVRLVKKFESGMVMNPITIHPGRDPRRRARRHEAPRHLRHSGGRARARTAAAGKLVGILTNRDVRFATQPGPAGRRADDQGPAHHRPRGRRPGRGEAPPAPVPHREAARRRRPFPLHRPDHRQGHREAGRLSARGQGRAGAPPRRGRDDDRRGRLRALRAPDRCRLRRHRRRHRARPFACACSRASRG